MAKYSTLTRTIEYVEGALSKGASAAEVQSALHLKSAGWVYTTLKKAEKAKRIVKHGDGRYYGTGAVPVTGANLQVGHLPLIAPAAPAKRRKSLALQTVKLPEFKTLCAGLDLTLEQGLALGYRLILKQLQEAVR